LIQPDWIKDEYCKDLRKARTEEEKLKAVATIATKEEESASESKKGAQFAEFRDARHRASKAKALSCEAITW
jgi:hypothetical protein